MFSKEANFKGAQVEPEMLSRLMGAIIHPLIHAGYGLEFGLPGLVAEGDLFHTRYSYFWLMCNLFKGWHRCACTNQTQASSSRLTSSIPTRSRQYPMRYQASPSFSLPFPFHLLHPRHHPARALRLSLSSHTSLQTPASPHRAPTRLSGKFLIRRKARSYARTPSCGRSMERMTRR